MQRTYTVLLMLLTPFVVMWLWWWRGRTEPGYRLNFEERFGISSVVYPGGLWIHAASMGEVAAAAPIMQVVRNRFPQLPMLITVLTPSGRDRAQALFPNAEVRYLPIDLPRAMESLVLRAQPLACIILETELWPNMLAMLYKHKIPAAIVNARLSDAKYERYMKYRNLFEPWIGTLAAVCTQTNEHAARWRALGARMPIVTGNTKFDIIINETQRNIGKQLRAKLGADRPVWIAASIHPGELQPILLAFRDLRMRFGNLVLLLVPRHSERFGDMVKACRSERWNVALRSRVEGDILTDIYIGDTMGELQALYAASDVAFVGGSMVQKGGHNPLEAAALGIPILCGPHMANFREVIHGLSDAGAVHTVRNDRDLESALTRILGSPILRADLGKRASAWVTLHGGAVARTLEALQPMLSGAVQQLQKNKEMAAQTAAEETAAIDKETVATDDGEAKPKV
ncbi:MAG: 3-deoxy-D-manno-octulosonic acid transferase [Gammaproteobacteria bacterium]|nr:3-deoxy-D-manno-octulosonic acid transferase [Gammaproteobacteria bacterium]